MHVECGLRIVTKYENEQFETAIVENADNDWTVDTNLYAEH